MQSPQLANLNWTRFVAAVLVVVYHFGDGTRLAAVPWLVQQGPIAVNYFYALSGFIMTVIYGQVTFEKAGAYWLARFARIYPLYCLCALWFALSGNWSLVDCLLNALLLQAWVPGHALSVNSVGWSLSAETAFYLAFPALMVWARRIGPGPFAGLAFAIWLATQILIALLTVWLKPTFPSWQHDLLAYWPPFQVNAFLLGISAAMLMPLIRVGPIPLLALGAALYWTLSLANAPQANGLYAPAFVVLIIGLAGLEFAPMRILALVFLGDVSYAIYISQMTLADAIGWLGEPWTDLRIVAYIPIIVLTSALLFLGIERPMRWLIRALPDLLARRQHRALLPRGEDIR